MTGLSSNYHFKKVGDRLQVGNLNFKETGPRKGIHFYKHNLWGKILALFNRAVKFHYYDVDAGSQKKIYISTVSLKHFKERCLSNVEGFTTNELDTLIDLVIKKNESIKNKALEDILNEIWTIYESQKNEDSEAIFNAFTQTINSHNLTESERLKLLNLLLTSDTLSQEEFFKAISKPLLYGFKNSPELREIFKESILEHLSSSNNDEKWDKLTPLLQNSFQLMYKRFDLIKFYIDKIKSFEDRIDRLESMTLKPELREELHAITEDNDKYKLMLQTINESLERLKAALDQFIKLRVELKDENIIQILETCMELQEASEREHEFYKAMAAQT